MGEPPLVTPIIEAVLQGNRLALARLLTQIENDTPESRLALNVLFPHTGHAHLIGITGAPGTGKSSLVNQLALHFRKVTPPKRVGIVAVDPSSPFTGGAILGDRVRMRDLVGDSGVFIRSMASRGSLGGLSATTSGVVQALDAAGYEIILIETVGAGQSEVEIAHLAHTTLVVEAPGLGDEIQAIKAGILEIADVLVVNKADQPGVEATARALRSMLQLAHPVPRVFRNSYGNSNNPTEEAQQGEGNEQTTENSLLWIPPIYLTVATEGKGISDLGRAIEEHYQYLVNSGELERRDRHRLKSELNLLLRETLVWRWRRTITDEHYEQVLHHLVRRELAPWEAVEWLLERKQT